MAHTNSLNIRATEREREDHIHVHPCLARAAFALRWPAISDTACEEILSIEGIELALEQNKKPLIVVRKEEKGDCEMDKLERYRTLIKGTDSPLC